MGQLSLSMDTSKIILQVNSDAFGEGWIMKVELSDPKEAENLMDSGAYEKLCEEEDH